VILLYCVGGLGKKIAALAVTCNLHEARISAAAATSNPRNPRAKQPKKPPSTSLYQA